MTAQIIDGTEIARQIRQEITEGVRQFKERSGIIPGLAAVLVGDDPASRVYVRNKERACQEAGIFTQTFHLPATISQEELLALIRRLNQDPHFHGILTQLPFPSHMNEGEVICALDPDKDVDGLHPVNMGRLAQGMTCYVPATPAGIQQLLLRTGHPPQGKHVVMCGRSNIVGKPMAVLLMQKQDGANATVTVCHTATQGLAAITRQADILIVAVGRPKTVTADMVKEGAVVIDVGINRVEDPSRKQGYRLVGDVDFEAVSEKAAAITPVPGGVGPMTVAMLVSNTLKAARWAVGG